MATVRVDACTRLALAPMLHAVVMLVGLLLGPAALASPPATGIGSWTPRDEASVAVDDSGLQDDARLPGEQRRISTRERLTGERVRPSGQASPAPVRDGALCLVAISLTAIASDAGAEGSLADWLDHGCHLSRELTPHSPRGPPATASV